MQSNIKLLKVSYKDEVGNRILLKRIYRLVNKSEIPNQILSIVKLKHWLIAYRVKEERRLSHEISASVAIFIH